MIGSLLNSTTIPLLEKVAVFGERRQEVLAGNLANIDTPNYKTRDLPVADFMQALKKAATLRDRPRSPGSLSSAVESPADQIARLFPDELFRAVEAPARNITFQDGGNRSIEHEVMEMTKNVMKQNFAVELMVAQMNLLETVISGRL